MTKASDNAFPSVLITEGTEPAAPAAGKQRLYIDSTTHHLKRTDSGGTDVDIESAAANGLATDTLWDAAGDLVVGTGANTAARLAPGTATQALMGGTSPAWGPAASSGSAALTAASVNPTLGTGGTSTNHYIQIGKLVVVWGVVIFGSSGVNPGAGEYHVALPVTAASPQGGGALGSCVLYDSSAGTFNLAVGYFSSSTVCRFAITGTNLVVTEGTPWTWAANDQINYFMAYEAA